MTATTTKDVQVALADLVSVCRDGRNGFELAASEIMDTDLRFELMDYSVQRDVFGLELKETLGESGEEPDADEDEGTVAGHLHRAWMDLKGALGSKDRQVVLACCEHGESAAVEAYHKALAADLPPSTRNLVQMQCDAVQRAHDRIKQLRESLGIRQATDA